MILHSQCCNTVRKMSCVPFQMNKYNSFSGGVQYSPLDMAEYVFWTGDEKGVTMAIEEFLQEGLVSAWTPVTLTIQITQCAINTNHKPRKFNSHWPISRFRITINLRVPTHNNRRSKMVLFFNHLVLLFVLLLLIKHKVLFHKHKECL